MKAEILLNCSLRDIKDSGMRTEGREEIEIVLQRKLYKTWQMMNTEKKIKMSDFVTLESWNRIIDKGRKAKI